VHSDTSKTNNIIISSGALLITETCKLYQLDSQSFRLKQKAQSCKDRNIFLQSFCYYALLTNLKTTQRICNIFYCRLIAK
jgi:hypothetical protein